MAKEGSVAPQERVNITYKPSTGNAKDEVELPLKMLFIGDYTGRADPRPLEERKPINVDKDNFTQVLAEQNLSLSIHAKDELSGDKGAELAVNLKFKKLSDFGPDAVAEQVPELKELLELRAGAHRTQGAARQRARVQAQDLSHCLRTTNPARSWSTSWVSAAERMGVEP